MANHVVNIYQGPVLWTPKGNWADGLSFVANDLVHHDGASWLCTQPHTSAEGTEPGAGVGAGSVWQKVASAGPQGPQGPQGEPGESGGGVNATILAVGSQYASFTAVCPFHLPPEARASYASIRIRTTIQAMDAGTGGVKLSESETGLLGSWSEVEAEVEKTFVTGSLNQIEQSFAVPDASSSPDSWFAFEVRVAGGPGGGASVPYIIEGLA